MGRRDDVAAFILLACFSLATPMNELGLGEQT